MNLAGCELSPQAQLRLQQQAIQADDLIVVCCLRNERLRLPDFLRHHRALGIQRFIMVDNLSDDGSAEYLDQQNDVIRLIAAGRYSENACGISWTNAVTLELCPHNWVLTLDADELFVYPDYEQQNLRVLVDYLEKNQANALRAPMLDMYPPGALEDSDYDAGDSLLERFPWFDAGGYESANIAGQSYIQRGGPRARVFWPANTDQPPPYMMKIPLYQWAAAAPYTMSTHLAREARFSEVSGVLLHFKFMRGFGAYAAQEVARGEHFEQARQYLVYHQQMQKQPDLQLRNADSERFENSQQLVRLGIMYAPKTGFHA